MQSVAPIVSLFCIVLLAVCVDAAVVQGMNYTSTYMYV